MKVLADLTPDTAEGYVVNLWAAQTTIMASLALGVGELAEGDTYLADGCRDMTEWLTARCAMAPERAREVETVGTALRKLPHIAAALGAATISWDQARVLVRFATPDTDADWAESAASMTVAQLRREAALAKPPSGEDADAAREQRTLRFGKVVFTDARHRGPTPSQLLALWDRDGGCVHPGCRTKCHLHVHHITHYEDGGLTVLSNMVLLCGRHHHYHHEGGGNTTGDPYSGLIFHRPDATIIPNAPPGIDPAIRDVIWN